jgi:hypothetical protein
MRSLLDESSRDLHSMFSLTYGEFFTQHTALFQQLFGNITAFYNEGNHCCDAIKSHQLCSQDIQPWQQHYTRSTVSYSFECSRFSILNTLSHRDTLLVCTGQSMNCNHLDQRPLKCKHRYAISMCVCNLIL